MVKIDFTRTKWGLDENDSMTFDNIMKEDEAIKILTMYWSKQGWKVTDLSITK